MNYEKMTKAELISKIKSLSELTSDYIYHISVGFHRQMLVDWIGEGFTHITGYTSDDVKTPVMWKNLVHPDDISTVMEKMQNIISGNSEEYECRIITKKSETIWLHVYGRPEWDAKKRNVTGIIGAASNITKRKQTEEKLKENEKRLRILTQNMPVMMDAFDGQWNIIEWNHECERITGYSMDEIVGNPKAMELLYPDKTYRESMMRKWIERSDDYYDWEWNITCKDGNVKTVSWSNISKLFPISGWATWGIGVDITDRKLVEEKLRVLNESLEQRIGKRTAQLKKINENLHVEINESKQIEKKLLKSEERFRAIFEQAAVGVAQIATKTGQFVRINKRYCDIAGYTQEEMTSTTFMKITHPDDLQTDLNNMQKLKEGKIREFSMEKRYYRKDGSIVWVYLTVSPMWDVGEQPDYHIAVVEDITKRKQAEEELLKSKETLDHAQKIAHLGSWESDIVKNRTIWSDEVYRQFGLIPQEFDGRNKSFLDFVHPDDKESVKKAVKEALYKRRPYDIDFRIVLKDGTERILHSEAEVVFDYNGKPQKMIGTSLDVTERKQVDKAIQTLVKSVVGKTGQEFFDKIVISMNEWLGTDCAFIGQITDGNNVKVLSMQMDGKIDHDFGYTLSGEPTPCGNVVESGFVIYSEGVCRLFPNDKPLLEMKAEGYVGTPLRNKDGKTVGLLWAVSRHKLNLPLRAVEVMDILAAKASSEIERKQIEECLLNSEEALHIAKRNGRGLSTPCRTTSAFWICPAPSCEPTRPCVNASNQFTAISKDSTTV